MIGLIVLYAGLNYNNSINTTVSMMNRFLDGRFKENYYFETLNESHYLNDFDCGDEDLNDFLKNDALKQQNAK